MKTFKTLSYFAVIFLLFSCKSTKFYQLYEVKADAQIEVNTNLLVYENEHCMVSYYLWSDEGNIGFKFYNKSEEDIYLSLDKSFFILNDIASPYHSTCSGSVLEDSTKGDCFMIIPSKTARYVTKFTINDNLIRDCDLYKYPSRSEINTIYFDQSNSPLVFSNRLTYELESQNQSHEFENMFYVAGVTNYPEREFIGSSKEDICNQKLVQPNRIYRHVAADKFYNIYYRSNSRLKY